MSIPRVDAAGDVLDFKIFLPSFDALDIVERRWTPESFRGKFTVVQLWATWCIPCRQEHPALQEFTKSATSANRLQVLTFSVDDDLGAVRAYTKEKGFTFPVIVDGGLARRLFTNDGGIPLSWVVGPNGRRSDSFKSLTFGRILLEVERMARQHNESAADAIPHGRP